MKMAGSAISNLKNRLSGPALLAIIGLILVIISGVQFATDSRELSETTAKVKYVDDHEEENLGLVSDITFDYTVNGTDYRGTIANADRGKYKEGDEFTVYYKNGDPKVTTTSKNSKQTASVFLVVGIVMVAGTFALTFYNKKKQLNSQRKNNE